MVDREQPASASVVVSSVSVPGGERARGGTTDFRGAFWKTFEAALPWVFAFGVAAIVERMAFGIMREPEHDAIALGASAILGALTVAALLRRGPRGLRW